MTAGIGSAAPTFEAIGDKTVTENDLLSFTVHATDTDVNATITYSIVDSTKPAGANFDKDTFSWTPFAGAAGPYDVTFIATANGLQDSETITITVVALDKTALATAITDANVKVVAAIAGVEVGQYPQTAIDTFKTAIAAAQAVADSTTATQTQISQAVSTLQTAQTTFDAAIIKSVDKTALTTAITAANTKVAAALAGTGIGQYPQTAIDTFKAAIFAAQTAANTATTQAAVNQALTTLKAAETTFDAAKVTGAASVTNLKESATGKSWITWAWTNPASNFKYVMIYIDGTFITNTTNAYYNATGFAEGTVHTIGTQTVDMNGNVNPTTVSDQATTQVTDLTPPGPVTNLHETNAGASWVYWTWTKPADTDFSNARISIDGTFVTTTPNSYYNATGLTNGVEHTISITTVDTSGNENTAQVSDAATTLKLPVISNVAGTNIKANSITLQWDASEDTTSVRISQDSILLATVNESTYVHSNLNSSTTYNYTLVPYNQNGLKGEAVSISLTTSSSSSSGGSSGGSSSSKKSSSGGGGGGATSVEDLANVAVKDVNNQYLRINTNATYEFSREGNDILSVSFYSLKNSGEITSSIEVLNNRSKLVNTNPEGLVCKYINIWVGKAGFATSNNIKDARVIFKVNNSWMQEMGITTDDIKLQRYNGTAWEVLPTTLENNTTSYSIFEARTPGFSPFAITAVKALAAVNTDIDNSTTSTSVEDIGLEGTSKENSRVWTYIMAFLLIAIIAVGYEYMKKQNN